MLTEENILGEVFTRICGKGAIVLIPILKDKRNVDEFKIASKSHMIINQVRNILYKLSHHDLVSFTRKKDKKKGWYIYFWTLNKERVVRLLREVYQTELDNLQNQIKTRQKKSYFVCPRGHTELSEEVALEQNFECLECGELLVLKEETSDIKRMQREIERLKKTISELSSLIDKYEVAAGSAVKRREHKEKKEREHLRKLKAAKRKREKTKLLKVKTRVKTNVKAKLKYAKKRKKSKKR